MEQAARFERQCEELEVLESIFSRDQEIQLPANIARIKEWIMEQNETTLPSMNYLDCTIFFLDYPVEDEIPQLCLLFPFEYPTNTPVQCSFLSSKLSPAQLTRINDGLIELAQRLVGEEAVFQIYQYALEQLQEIYVEADPEEDVRETKDENVQEDIELIDPEFTYSNDAPVLGRRAIYFHHIIANSKRKAVVEWAVSLNLGGYSKIGWPGVVIVEGPEVCCQEYVRRLQHLRWKQMVVRGEQVEHGELGQSMDSLRKLPLAFREFPENGMSQLASCCREVGLEDLFLCTMKIYNKKEKKGPKS